MSPKNGIKAACTGLVMAAGMAMLAGAVWSDGLVPLENPADGPYGKPTFMVANSANEWNEQMRKLEANGSLAIVPGPEAPQDVDWSRECVVLIAAGRSGYDVSLTLTARGTGRVELAASYTPLVQDGGESLPYYLGKMEKHAWLPTQLWEGADVVTALPLSGVDSAVPAGLPSWGAVKALYR